MISLKLYSYIKRPLLTEKTARLQKEHNTIAFEVLPQANKQDIKNIVEKIFDMKVLKVRTVNIKGKVKRIARSNKFGKRNNIHKAYVTLAEKIDQEKINEFLAKENASNKK